MALVSYTLTHTRAAQALSRCTPTACTPAPAAGAPRGPTAHIATRDTPDLPWRSVVPTTRPYLTRCLRV